MNAPADDSYFDWAATEAELRETVEPIIVQLTFDQADLWRFLAAWRIVMADHYDQSDKAAEELVATFIAEVATVLAAGAEGALNQL